MRERRVRLTPSLQTGAGGEWADDRLRRLQRISLGLNAAMSMEAVAAVVVSELDAPVSTPTRILYLIDADREHLELVAHHNLPEGALERYKRIAIDDDLPGAVAVRERRTVVSTGQLQAVHEFAALEGTPRSTEGFAAIPLLTDDDCVGLLALGVDYELSERELGFLEAVAAQVAQGIVRVRLIERERRRRLELEFIANLTDTALGAVDHVDLMRSVCQAAVPTLGDWCSLYFLPGTGGMPLIEFAHADPDMAAYVQDLHRRYPFDPQAATGPPAVIRTGATEFVPRLTAQLIDEAVAASGYRTDEVLPVLDRLAITSVITVPLRTKHGTVGAMQFVSSESKRRYTVDDVALAEAVAGRLAEALVSAWMADHQHAVAVSLQQAFLPPRLARIPGIDLAARYWPAGIDQVGGDFYDVFPIGDNTWALLIGDVCGTGPDAAALTGIARHTVRAAARHGGDHARVVDWLNEAILHSDRDRFCTACYATLTRHADRWKLTTTSAGHPLPIVSNGISATPIGRPGQLIGVFDGPATATTVTELDAGDVFFLYTDGLTDLPPPFGIDEHQLAALVHRHRHHSADQIALAIRTELETRVPDRHRRDDVALLVGVIR